MEFMPSPPWGRWWLATGVLISRGEPGEGVYPSLYYAALSKTGFSDTAPFTGGVSIFDSPAGSGVIGMGSLSKDRSFPRRRQSNPQAIGKAPPTDWIPAFAE